MTTVTYYLRVHLSFAIRQKFGRKFPRPRPAPPPHTCDLFYKYEMHPSLLPTPYSLLPTPYSLYYIDFSY
ncbi:hypothetical protein [Moorena producens]|uniref:hypothetical protein n=1 Tax=Moorena producens TaxID=1155739 RepID=UPI000A8AC3D4|nr:hypothetical protein [Moorena producens]